jgi:hypothetical protein
MGCMGCVQAGVEHPGQGIHEEERASRGCTTHVRGVEGRPATDVHVGIVLLEPYPLGDQASNRWCRSLGVVHLRIMEAEVINFMQWPHQHVSEWKVFDGDW